jgi:hypothetical protein
MIWLDRYLEYTKNFESPTLFHYWSGVWAIGSALGRKVWTRTGSEIHYPNSYIILVSPSAVARKSTAMSKAMALLNKAGGFNIMRDKLTDAALWKRLAKLTLDQGASTLSIHVDELSTCFSPDNVWSKDLISSLTRLYIGEDLITKDLAGCETMEIKDVCVSFLAGTTPTDLMTIFPRATTGMGFSGRCLFIFEHGRRFKNPSPKLVMEHEQPLVMGLREFAKVTGEIPMSPMALDYYNSWYMKQPEIHSDDINSSFIARKHIHMVHLALIMTISKREREISRVTMGEAEAQVSKVQTNLKYTLEKIGMAPMLQDVETLKEMLERAGGRATRGQLIGMKKLDRWRLNEAIEHLRELNQIDTDFRASGTAGRPALTICLKQQEGK